MSTNTGDYLVSLNLDWHDTVVGVSVGCSQVGHRWSWSSEVRRTSRSRRGVSILSIRVIMIGLWSETVRHVRWLILIWDKRCVCLHGTRQQLMFSKVIPYVILLTVSDVSATKLFIFWLSSVNWYVVFLVFVAFKKLDFSVSEAAIIQTTEPSWFYFIVGRSMSWKKNSKSSGTTWRRLRLLNKRYKLPGWHSYIAHNN